MWARPPDRPVLGRQIASQSSAILGQDGHFGRRSNRQNQPDQGISERLQWTKQGVRGQNRYLPLLYRSSARRRGDEAGIRTPHSIEMNVIPPNLVWRQRAACRGVDPDVFYPATDEEAEAAKAICGQCSVRQACLEYALSNRERDGVWGGCTERERRRIIRQRRKSA